MSARARGLPTNHTLPPDPAWISFHRSDGNTNRLPANITPNPDHEGHVNFMRPCVLDESISVHWRRQIGAEVAKRLNYPEGKIYIIQSWPAGYQMYDHNKGPQAAPRHDPYLVGSEYVARFRSPAEFIPHAIWLLTDPTNTRSNCACKYCSKTPQRTVSDVLGLSQSSSRNRPISSTLSPSHSRSRTSGREPHKIFATTRVAPIQIKIAKGPRQYMVPEREKDLRAAISSKGMKTKRWAREGELVWCALNPPIALNENSLEKEWIMFWPGLVQETRLRPEIRTFTNLNGSVDRDVEMTDGTDHNISNGSAENTSASSNNAPNGSSHDDDVPWTVTHSTIYKMKLLAVATDCLVHDSQILPYQAYAPSNELLKVIDELKIYAKDEFDLDMDGDPQEAEERLMDIFQDFQPILHDLNPHREFPGTMTARFHDAAGPFALAIQIASRIAGYWTPTDEYQLKMTYPSRNKSHHWEPQHQLLPSVPANSSRPPYGQVSSNYLTPIDPVTNGTSGPSRNPLPPNELQALNTRMLGVHKEHHNPNSVWTQTRFQGLWWGAERIWMDEMVRLKVGRHQLAPEGAEMIKRPSSPSSSTYLYTTEEQNSHGDTDEPVEPVGAAGRGVFMRVEGFFIVEVQRSDGYGTSKECRVCGMLYELADEDWIDPDESQNLTTNTLNPGSASNGIFNGTDTKRKGESSGDGNKPSPLGVHGTSQVGSSSFMVEPKSFLSDPGPNSNPDLSKDMFTTALSSAPEPSLTPAPPFRPSSVLSAPPKHPTYPLPAAPQGFKFRPILLPLHEAVVDITLLSGRYYPGILSHPLLHSHVAAGFEAPLLNQNTPLWALEGLVSGVHNAVDPTWWKPSRIGMVQEADTQAKRELCDFWRKKKADQEMINVD